MKIKDQLHGSKFHRDGFDPTCYVCLEKQGIKGIIGHLKSCAEQNEQDDSEASLAVASEQLRMIRVLKLYAKAMGIVL